MEFDREALDNQRAKLSNQRANVRSVLKRIGSEGLNPLARLQGEGLEKVLRCFLELQRRSETESL